MKDNLEEADAPSAEEINFRKIAKDDEIYEHFMRITLHPGDLLYDRKGDEIGTFLKFEDKYIGRLDNPGVKPGLYVNRSELLIDRPGKKVKLKKTVDCFLDFPLFEGKWNALSENWHFIDINEDFIEDIPDTPFIEGDIIRLIDETHENYSEDLSENQFTIYRIDYASVKDKEGESRYRLRAGPLLFYATENQIKAAAHGLSPIRILNSGQTVRFRTLKDEAEFYLLIGCYKRIFNPINFSYKWELATAKQMIDLSKAHGVAKKDDYYWLVIFDDDEIGRQIASAAIILEA